MKNKKLLKKKEKIEKIKRPKYYKEGKTRPRCQICGRLLSDVEYNICLICQDDLNEQKGE